MNEVNFSFSLLFWLFSLFSSSLSLNYSIYYENYKFKVFSSSEIYSGSRHFPTKDVKVPKSTVVRMTNISIDAWIISLCGKFMSSDIDVTKPKAIAPLITAA